MSDEGGWVTAAIAVGSALVQGYGQYQAGKAQADAMRQQAQLNLLKATEILERNDINNELLRESALVTQGTQVAQTFASGKTLASTRNLVEQTMQTAKRQIELNTRAAEWEARMVRMGAESSIGAADKVQEAAMISSLATAGFGMARAYSNAPSYSSDTPTTPSTNYRSID